MKCNCKLCEGKYIQVDPMGCGCTECIIGEYRPAINDTDYLTHDREFCICEQVSGDNELCVIHPHKL